MFKIFTIIATYLIGKSLNAANNSQGPSPFLFRLPLLMIRKILKLFMVGFGSLLIGVMGVGFLVKDLLFQLQTQSQLLLTPSMGVSLIVAILGFAVCILTFRKKNWLDAGDLTIPVEPLSVSGRVAAIRCGHSDDQFSFRGDESKDRSSAIGALSF